MCNSTQPSTSHTCLRGNRSGDLGEQGRPVTPNMSIKSNVTLVVHTTHLHRTAYHPQANDMVEKLHEQQKAAIVFHTDTQLTRTLPTVLLGIRVAWKEGLQAKAELVYGQVFIKYLI